MQSFGAKLDWTAQQLSFIDMCLTIPAVHSKHAPQAAAHCSVLVTHETSAEAPVYIARNCAIESGQEAAVSVYSNIPPTLHKTALTEPYIKTASLQKHDIFWQNIAVAKTVCNWAAAETN